MDELLTNAYDILFPSPPTLKDIAAISMAVQLWRQEINTHRIKNTLDRLNLQQNIISNNPTPRVSDGALSLIEKYVKQVGISIKTWLELHSNLNLFKADIFNDFIDFVADFDGTIHYVRTAKRIVSSDRIDQIIRLKIACTYCFEDDISRISPTVISELNATRELCAQNFLLYYWICRLKNQLYKLPSGFTGDNQSMRESFLRHHFPYPWSSFEYFWNGLDGGRKTSIISASPSSFNKFYRYLLAKFNETELNKFANSRGCEIIVILLCNIPPLRVTRDGRRVPVLSSEPSFINSDILDRGPYIMAIWECIKNKMNENRFFSLVRRIIRSSSHSQNLNGPLTRCKLWNTAPDHLKLHAVQRLLQDDSLFQGTRNELVPVPVLGPVPVPHSQIDSSFLMIVLLNASVEDRNPFWDKHWRSLVTFMCTKQLNQLISLCCNNDENKIIEVKLNSVSVFENVRQLCSKLLNSLSFEKLNEFLSFCFPDEETRKNVRLNLLLEDFKLSSENIMKVSPQLNDFINDAFDDANLAADFKTRLLFSPSTVAELTTLLDSEPRYYYHDVSFIDVLAPTEQMRPKLRRFYIRPLLMQKLSVDGSPFRTEEMDFTNFIGKCLESDDETASFKETLSVDEIVQDVIRRALLGGSGMGLKCNYFLVMFLEWYFDTSQALEEFKAKYADDDVFAKLTTKGE